MTITYLPDTDRLRVDEPTISTGSGLFISIEAAVTLDCGSEKTEEYSSLEVVDSINSKFYIIPGELHSLYFKPDMWGLTVFVDGIYYIRLKLWLLAGGYTQMSNCAFVDVTIKCKVAQLMKDVIEGGTNTMAHMLHYSLVNGSNCGCNCDELCANFKALEDMLADTTLQITNDCGCK